MAAPDLQDVLLTISQGKRRFEPADSSEDALREFQWVVRCCRLQCPRRGAIWISAEVEGISDYGAECLAARE